MDSNTIHTSPPHPTDHVLVVADWRVNARAVITACERRNEKHACAFGLVVPAWLHGIEWTGDPSASFPCAQRQVATITALAAAAGRTFGPANVADPEPVIAICDALADWPADELLICARAPRFGVHHPFDLAHRAHRVTGLAVQSISVPTATSGVNRGHWLRLRIGHCAFD